MRKKDEVLGRVLLVDDDERVLSALCRVLRREPYVVETVRDGTDALARAASDPSVDVVISDYKMPGMTGIELLTKLRETHPQIARILMSGWTGDLPESDSQAAGLFTVLSKPWDDSYLKTSIREALSLPRSPD